MRIIELIQDEELLRIEKNIRENHVNLLKRIDENLKEAAGYCTTNIIQPSLRLIENKAAIKGDLVDIQVTNENGFPSISVLYTKAGAINFCGKANIQFRAKGEVRIKKGDYRPAIPSIITDELYIEDINYLLIKNTFDSFFSQFDI